MSIEKKFLKSKPTCKVKFTLSGDPYTNASSVLLVGDFNHWQVGETPLKKSKTGEWSVTLDLPASGTYQFRYLVDGTNWVNDPEADGYVPSGLGSENAVIEL